MSCDKIERMFMIALLEEEKGYLSVVQKNKNRIYFFTFLALTLCWVAVIWGMSLQPADVSSETSLGFGEWLVETFLTGQMDKIHAMSAEQIAFWHHVLRKCAHFTEYMILGVLMYMTWAQSLFKYGYKILYSVCTCAAIACIDETIQLFVPGRCGKLTDILLDNSGAIMGVLLGMITVWFVKKRLRQK